MPYNAAQNDNDHDKMHAAFCLAVCWYMDGQLVDDEKLHIQH